MNEVPTYFRYWGKAERGGDRFHLLPYHCLDVAAVGRLLLAEDTSLCRKFVALTGLEDTVCCRWLILFLALHDLGKFSESFQNLRPDLLEKLQNKKSTRPYGIRHDSLGNLLWIDHLWRTVEDGKPNAFPEIDDELDEWQDIFRGIIKAFAGHHGKPPELSGPNNMRLSLSGYFGSDDTFAVDEFTMALSTIFPCQNNSEGLAYLFEFEEQMQTASWLMAGFVVLCDWIGSNTIWFPFQGKPVPLAEYWKNQALPQAEWALKKSGVGKPEPVNEDMTFARLFPTIVKPTPLQCHVADCSVAENPQIFILEDVPGSGKTEAALLLAGRLMSAGCGSGFFIALPTMATSNAMYERMVMAYHRLYADHSTPSLVLAHAARHLSSSFMAVINGPDEFGADEETATAQCSAWLADNRKKALLADVGVGTIDQALLAVLPVRFQSLRLFGLAGHILIVDEVHAYDPYMNKLLQTLLSFHAALGGSAILLSATLPMYIRKGLLAAFARGCGEQQIPLVKSNAYPLATVYSRETSLTEAAIEAFPQSRCSVMVKLISEQDEIECLIEKTVRHGKCICWIRNTVHDALVGYARLKERVDTETLMLFHARFAMGDRLKIENTVTKTFGRESGARERSGKVLIATQVVEQSLDLDFDLLVSDLAPMDRLIQRAGRLHRHPRDENGNPLTAETDRRDPACFVIHGPLPVGDVPGDWYKSAFPKAAFVYPNHGCLWLTASLLAAKGAFRMPEDARDLIETAFAEYSEVIPESLRQRDLVAEAQWQADRSLAHINMLKLEEGYTATINQWREDMKTPTRLGGMETTVRLARWDGKVLTPWYAEGNFPWDMSQVSLRSTLVDEEAELDDPLLVAAVAQLKESFSDRGKWSVLVPLSQGEDGRWRGYALNKRRDTMVVEYDGLTGVMVSQKEG